MKLSVDLKDLKDTVGHAAQVLSNRPVVPVLGGIVLSLADGVLQASSFDYETAATATLDILAGDEGRLLVPGRALFDMLGRLPAGTVEVVAEGSTVTLTAGRAVATLPLMAIAEYPELPALPKQIGVVDGEALARAFKHCAESMPTDNEKLFGVNVIGEAGSLHLASTDSFRLHTFELPWNGDDVVMTVPPSALKSVQSVTGPVRLHADESTLAIVSDTRTTITRLIAKEYVRWRTLVGAPTHLMLASTDDLSEALQRAALVCEKGDRVNFNLDGNTLTLDAGHGDSTRTVEDLEVDYSGPAIETAFNPRFLHGALAPVESGRVQLGFTKPHAAVLVTDPAASDYKGIVMPMRVLK